MPSRYSIIPVGALSDSRLSDGDIRVFAALGSFTDSDGKCWPSTERVAEVAGCAIRSVRRSVTKLASLGYMRRVERWGRSNVYVVKLDTPDTTVPLPRTVESSPPDCAVLHNVPSNVPREAVGHRLPDSIWSAGSAFLRDPKTRQARVGEIQMLLGGARGSKVSEAAVARGLSDMAATGTPFSPVILKRFAERAVKLLAGEEGARAGQDSLKASSPVSSQPDANQTPSGGWFSEDETES